MVVSWDTSGCPSVGEACSGHPAVEVAEDPEMQPTEPTGKDDADAMLVAGTWAALCWSTLLALTAWLVSPVGQPLAGSF